MNDGINDWIKTQLKSASRTGVTYYAARQRLIDKGYAAKDIDVAVKEIRAAAVPEDSDIIVWLSKYEQAVRSESNKAFGISLLSKTPFVGPVFGVQSIKQSFDITSNMSGLSRKRIALTWVVLMIAVAAVAYILPGLLHPVAEVLPFPFSLGLLLVAQYAVPVILVLIIWRRLFRRK